MTYLDLRRQFLLECQFTEQFKNSKLYQTRKIIAKKRIHAISKSIKFFAKKYKSQVNIGHTKYRSLKFFYFELEF